MTRCKERRLVDRHFELRLDAAGERRLREHLSDCAACRRYYERWQLFEKLDPAASDPQERLAFALGLRRSAMRRWRRPAWALPAALVAAAACVALLVMRPRPAPEFQARGIVAEPRISAYRVLPNGKSSVLGDSMRANDELAFAYDNTRRATRLMIFGVDDRQHVYWYFPAWVDPAKSPVAVSITVGRHELPEAVAQHLEVGTLTLYAVFTDKATTVRDVEGSLGRYTKAAAWSKRVRVTP
jgi:hypothetical protein